MSLQNMKKMEFLHVVARYQSRTGLVRVAVFHDRGGTPVVVEDTVASWRKLEIVLIEEGVPYQPHNIPA